MSGSLRIACLCLLLIAMATSPTGAEVTVRFVEPERYTDSGHFGRDRERNLRALQSHLEQQGARCLADGETLAIDVLDVDLAGCNEWWHRAGHDLRVMRAIAWPQLDVGYVWSDAAGTVLQEGRERVTDMDYLRRSARVRFETAPLPYERAMLRDWFARRFCRATGPDQISMAARR